MKRRTMMLKTLVATVSFFLLVSSVYADPIPYTPPGPSWIEFLVEVIVSEAVAWLVGAELLFRLSKQVKQGVSRSDSYKIMFLAMVVSFSIGLLFWKIFGWI
jgi:magnesium-transporting ATPase (P-type)